MNAGQEQIQKQKQVKPQPKPDVDRRSPSGKEHKN